MESFGDRIKRLRKEQAMSQIELAKSIGVSQSNISAYESNQQEPKMTQLILLAQTFNTTVDYIVFGIS